MTRLRLTLFFILCVLLLTLTCGSQAYAKKVINDPNEVSAYIPDHKPVLTQGGPVKVLPGIRYHIKSGIIKARRVIKKHRSYGVKAKR